MQKKKPGIKVDMGGGDKTQEENGKLPKIHIEYDYTCLYIDNFTKYNWPVLA